MTARNDMIAAAGWLRNNYQDYPNIDALCEAMIAVGINEEPVHWRAVLDPEQVPQQLNGDLHVVGFRKKRDAEGWVASKLDFEGWRYTIEPLYAAPQPSFDMFRLLKALDQIYHQAEAAWMQDRQHMSLTLQNIAEVAVHALDPASGNAPKRVGGTRPDSFITLYNGSTAEPYIDIDGSDLWCNAEDFTREQREKIRWMIEAANAYMALEFKV